LFLNDANDAPCRRLDSSRLTRDRQLRHYAHASTNVAGRPPVPPVPRRIPHPPSAGHEALGPAELSRERERERAPPRRSRRARVVVVVVVVRNLLLRRRDDSDARTVEISDREKKSKGAVVPPPDGEERRIGNRGTLGDRDGRYDVADGTIFAPERPRRRSRAVVVVVVVARERGRDVGGRRRRRRRG